MSHDQTPSARIAQMAGISRNRALSNLRNGALQHHSIDGAEAQKFGRGHEARRHQLQRESRAHVERGEIEDDPAGLSRGPWAAS
jgi:hypothetical protein